MDELPCENCLVFPMCKMRLETSRTRAPNVSFDIAFLQQTCPLMKEYMSPIESESYEKMRKYGFVMLKFKLGFLRLGGGK
jgi:hypothetical protein